MINYIFLLITLLFPKVSFAEAHGISGLISATQKLVDLLIPIVFAVALLVFLWGLGIFVFKAGSEEARTEGRRLMFWGVIALFVMSSIWGLVAFLVDGLGIFSGGTAY